MSQELTQIAIADTNEIEVLLLELYAGRIKASKSKHRNTITQRLHMIVGNNGIEAFKHCDIYSLTHPEVIRALLICSEL